MRRFSWLERAGERGQALPLLALAMVALCGITGIAIDVGRLFAARTELTRSLDAGALAGVQQLPDLTKAKSIAINYVMTNEPTAINVTAVQDGGDPRRLRVSATKTVPMTFLKVLSVADVNISSSAVAGFGTIPMDVVMALDVTGSMRWDCVNGASGQTSDCKITEAKNAANALTDILLTGGFGAGNTVLGMAPFTDAYVPPSGPHASLAGYTNTAKVQSLTSSNSTMKSAIGNLSALGGTNICTGLLKAQELMFGANSHSGPDVLRAVVLMTDGGNSYSDPATASQCRSKPNSNPWGYLDVSYSAECYPSVSTGVQTPEGGEMDQKTYDLAKAMKQQGIEIYVVAVGVCGPLKPDLCKLSMIGDIPQTDRAHNLLKCVASSAPGTNDHYFETDDATELTAIFQQIARLLALRLLE